MSEPLIWKAGLARRSLNPKEAAWLAGYGTRTGPSTGILHGLEVKALALEGEQAAPAVLVSADLLGFCSEISDTIILQACKSYGLKPERILLTATHTHTAPVITGVLPLIYNFDRSQWDAVDRYTDFVIATVCEVIGEALDARRPAALEFGQGFAGFGVNRRRARPGCRHLPGPVDHDVPVLAVRGADRKLRGVVFGYACHATVLSGAEISGDYPGFARSELERTHKGCVAIFVPGCGGDINPLPRGSAAQAQRLGTLLSEAVTDTLEDARPMPESSLRIRRQSLSLPYAFVPDQAALESRLSRLRSEEEWLHDLTTIAPPKQRLPREKAENAARILAANERKGLRHHLERLEREKALPDHCQLPLATWQFGDGLTWIHLGGEPVVDYSLALKAQYGWDRTWVSGYCYDLTAYVPSLRVLREGHYEGTESMLTFGHPAPFAESVESLVLSGVEEMLSGRR